MADEKIIQYIGFQQSINLGDNYTVPSGTTVKAGGARKGFSRMQEIHEMKKQAAAEGLTLAEYMKKLKAEMEEAERAMHEAEEHSMQPNVHYAEAVEVSSEPVQSEPTKGLNEDDENRKLLKKSNVVFKNVQNEKPVDLLAIYKFIKEHFLTALTQQCEWVAVFCYFNNCKKLLAITEATKFAEQMMSAEWFGELKDDSKKACTNNGLKPYSFIYFEKDPKAWDISKKTSSSHASANGLKLIYNRYTDLELEGKDLDFLLKQTEASR